ncbi:hypothetical protein GOBAR_AA26676 [Gossypium barbadense]|uniref:Uncharacterized protein n=1 Tax=Gossypium barbadense TaxID=3634 RepID=A0A2P5WSD3_GOSBA|nr:hypothetical protein GOBAR_AA26676 [Gossypium barbadense]
MVVVSLVLVPTLSHCATILSVFLGVGNSSSMMVFAIIVLLFRPRNREDTVYKLASLLLTVIGGSYILLFPSGKGGKIHSHNQPLEKMVVVSLVLVPTLSHCATILSVFLGVGNSSSMMVFAIIVLLFRYKMKNDSEF